MNGTIATGLAEADERALIAASLDTLERVIDTRPARLAVDCPLAEFCHPFTPC